MAATVLIVDDNTANRALLTSLLGRDGYTSLEAANGAEGLGLARAHRPDLVIADLLMPKMDGYDFIRQLRSDEATSGIPVIIYTANYAAQEIREFAEGYGVAKVLTKPTDTQVILEAVRTAIATSPREPAELPNSDAFDREHLALLNSKLLQKVRELELADHERRQQLESFIRTHEDERERLAAQLLDGPIQGLTTVAMRLDLLADTQPDAELRDKHTALLRSVHRAIARLRRMLLELGSPPVERDGIGAAIGSFLQQIADDADLDVEFNEETSVSLRSEMAILLYRVAQEALLNVTRHARALRVLVSLQDADGGVLLRVADDGTGFDPDLIGQTSGGLGLRSMRERAELANGWWRVDAKPGAGTVVECWLPADAPAGRGG